MQGLEKFRNKLIPHVFMSKESFPPGLTSEGALAHAFQFIETWKAKLFDMLSSGGSLPGEVSQTSNSLQNYSANPQEKFDRLGKNSVPSNFPFLKAFGLKNLVLVSAKITIFLGHISRIR